MMASALQRVVVVGRVVVVLLLFFFLLLSCLDLSCLGTPFPLRTRLTTQHIQAIRYNVLCTMFFVHWLDPRHLRVLTPPLWIVASPDDLEW